MSLAKAGNFLLIALVTRGGKKAEAKRNRWLEAQRRKSIAPENPATAREVKAPYPAEGGSAPGSVT